MTFSSLRLMLAVVLVSGSALAQTNLGPIKVTTEDMVGTSTAPANPGTALCRSYYDLTSGQVKWINSGGANCGPTGTGPGNQLPGYSTAQYGTVGNGIANEDAAFAASLAACPQASPAVGCDIYIPAGLYNTTLTINLALLKGVHIHGSGASATGGCSTIIQAHGAIYGVTIGNGTSPNTSGFEIDNLCIQDMSGTGLGGFDVKATRDGTFWNVGVVGYQVGAHTMLDGGTNFTQFIHFYSPFTWQTKYGLITNNKTASIYVWGGEFNCQNSGLTDIITGSRAFDIGYTNHVASTGTGSEWAVDTQTQNCEIGIAIYNGGANHFWGKALEETINARPSNSFGVVVDGDTASLANGNFFDGVQIARAGTGFYLAPNATNTTIIDFIPNGTNGVDYVADIGAEGSTQRFVNKRLTGWQTNISDITRSSNVVTAHTTANSDNGDLAVKQGTLLQVFNVTGGTTNFNGKFPVASVSTNDSTNITTLTWNQTGANESGTINATGCGGLGSCVSALSTLLSSGVGILEVTGNNITQNTVTQVPTVPNQGFLPCLVVAANTTCGLWDGAFTDINEGPGLLHQSDGPITTYNGNASGSYSLQPTTFNGGVGTVNTSGTGPSTITFNSGNTFGLNWTGSITVNNVAYPITSVNSPTQITTSGNTGTQTGVNYEASGITGVPNCANPLGGICLTSDDKGFVYANNTNGSTGCLPPAGAANGYPAGFRTHLIFSPNTGGSVFSVTPAGHTSFYGIACLGTSNTLNGLPTSRNLTDQQSIEVYSDGSNWKIGGGQPPTIPLDQISNALSNTSTNLNPLTSGSWNGGGSGANNGQDFNEQGGSSNSTGGRGADKGSISGPDSASGKNGSVFQDQIFNAGIGLGSKNGFIVRPCRDVTGTDCANTVPAGNSGAVRLTISGTDEGPAAGIVVVGSGVNSPVEVRVSGVYGHDLTDGAVVETSCTAYQFYEIAETNASDNGAGQCTSTDSPRRVGIALLATSGTCNSSTPCHVPILIQPAAGIGQLIQGGVNAGCTTSCTITIPIPYQSAVPLCMCTGINGSCNLNPGGASKTQCVFNASASGGIQWVTIGAP